MCVCAYRGCKHQSKEITLTERFYKDEEVSPAKFYHEDCWRDSCNLKLVKKLWNDHINPKVNFGLLNRIFNELVSQEYETDYIVYALKDGIRRKVLKYPFGLKYVVCDEELYSQWRNNVAKRETAKYDFSVTEQEDAPSIQFQVSNTGFGSIFGGV